MTVDHKTRGMTASERAREYRGYVGRRVTVMLRRSDVYDSADDQELRGDVWALGLRVRGSADWTGHQYDMVLKCDDGLVRVFALSRIREVKEA